MKYTDYQLSEEYRDRHAFNQGDLFFLKDALESYANKIGNEIREMQEKGKQPIATPEFFEQMAQDLLSKAQQWTDK